MSLNSFPRHAAALHDCNFNFPKVGGSTWDKSARPDPQFTVQRNSEPTPGSTLTHKDWVI